jgi:hypothetical protein
VPKGKWGFGAALGGFPAWIAFLALGAVMIRILARPPRQLKAKIACH